MDSNQNKNRVGNFLKSTLGAFHDGVRNGTGKTETVQVNPGEQRSRSPYFRTLVNAAMAGVVLTAAVAPTLQAPQAGDLPSDPSGDVVTLEATASPDPGLSILSGALDKFVSDRDILIVHFEGDTTHFSDGFAPEDKLIDSYKEFIDSLGPLAYYQVASDANDLVPTEGRDSCLILSGGSLFEKSAEQQAAWISNINDVEVDGEVITEAADRINTDLSRDNLTTFIAYHEGGHCVDELMAIIPSTLNEDEAAYMEYEKEIFADSFAAIMTSLDEGDTSTARQFADLRMISTPLVGSFWDAARMLHRTGSGEDSYFFDNIAARYHSAPIMDATVAWIEDTGIEDIKAMAPNEILDQARAIVEEHKMSVDEYSDFSELLLHNRVGDGQLLFNPRMPEGFGERVTQAMENLHFTPVEGDTPELEVSPAWEWEGLEAASTTISPENFPDRSAEATSDSGPEMDFSKFLQSDLDAGASIRAVEMKGSGTHILLEELDGSRTKAVISGKGDVLRYDADGKLSSLSDDRPAMVRADGAPTHVVIQDGQQYRLEPGQSPEADFTHTQAAYAAPGR